MATKRTARTGETLPLTASIAPSNAIRLKAIKLICNTCAQEYCPNFLQYALPNTAPVGTMDTKQPCDYCKAHSPVGVTDPANYGGMSSKAEK